MIASVFLRAGFGTFLPACFSLDSYNVLETEEQNPTGAAPQQMMTSVAVLNNKTLFFCTAPSSALNLNGGYLYDSQHE